MDGVPIGVIMGKDIRNHKCPLSMRLAWLRSVLGLLITREGREISKIFDCVQGIDKRIDFTLQERIPKGELAFCN